jgi:exoribonuclease R
MKTIVDSDRALTDGLTAIRRDFQVPGAFPADVMQAAQAATRRALAGRVDRTGDSFVTLDPASSTDLDQAFAIERAGADIMLRYAIADVDWFVEDGDPIDQEAWRRAETIYLPDGKASLYPQLLSEGAASLLPNVERPAVIFAVRIAPDGGATLDGAERAVIRSSAKLAYDSVRPEDLPPDFAELSRRFEAADAARGASRVDPPEQEIERDDHGRLHLGFRARCPSEDQNAALSLATNMAIAKTLLAHHTGLFRVMAPPNADAVVRLRHLAAAIGLDWPAAATLEQFSQTLEAADPTHAAMMLAIRKAGDSASYAPYRPGIRPWHAALSATYAHATAPLRRLADRYVIRAALAIANGQPIAPELTDAFERLPPVMARGDARAGQIERAVVDLAEAALLSGREGERFAAAVVDVDSRGARIQLADFPVIARLPDAPAAPGAQLEVCLTEADPTRRLVRFVKAA